MSPTEVKGTLIPPPGKANQDKARRGAGVAVLAGSAAGLVPVENDERTQSLGPCTSRYDQPVFVHDRFHLRHVGRPARVHDSRNVFELSFPRDRGCECYERAGISGIKVVEAAHGASWHEQGVARFQSMRHPVERDCQRPAETIPNFFEIRACVRG